VFTAEPPAVTDREVAVAVCPEAPGAKTPQAAPQAQAVKARRDLAPCGCLPLRSVPAILADSGRKQSDSSFLPQCRSVAMIHPGELSTGSTQDDDTLRVHFLRSRRRPAQ